MPKNNPKNLQLMSHVVKWLHINIYFMPISTYDNLSDSCILDLMLVYHNNIPSAVNIYRYICHYKIGVLAAAYILSDYYQQFK